MNTPIQETQGDPDKIGKTTGHPIFAVTFRIKRERRPRTIYGVWSAELKNDVMWIYTNEPDGAYFVNDVASIVEVCANIGTMSMSINDTVKDTKRLIHLLDQEEEE